MGFILGMEMCCGKRENPIVFYGVKGHLASPGVTRLKTLLTQYISS